MDELDSSKKEAVLSALVKCRGIVTDACNMAGVGRSTFYYWKENDPQFAASVKDAEEQAIDFVEGKLFKLIENEDVTSTIFFLKTRGKSRGYGQEDAAPPQTTVIIQKVVPNE